MFTNNTKLGCNYGGVVFGFDDFHRRGFTVGREVFGGVSVVWGGFWHPLRIIEVYVKSVNGAMSRNFAEIITTLWSTRKRPAICLIGRSNCISEELEQAGASYLRAKIHRFEYDRFNLHGIDRDTRRLDALCFEIILSDFNLDPDSLRASVLIEMGIKTNIRYDIVQKYKNSTTTDSNNYLVSNRLMNITLY